MIGDLDVRRLGAGGVGGMCGERGCIRECAGAADCSGGRLLMHAGGNTVLLPIPFVRGDNLVVSSLATVPHLAL